MHDESAHLPETQQCNCESESAQVCAESPESSSLSNALSTKVKC